MPEETTNPELVQNTVIICVGGHAINSAHFRGYAIEKSIASRDDEHFTYKIVALGGIDNKFESQTICAVSCRDFDSDNAALEVVIDILTELLQGLNDDDFEIWSVNDHSYFGGE